MQIRPPRLVVPSLAALLLACAPASNSPSGDAGTDAGADAGAPARTSFAWRPIELGGVPPMWGAFFAAKSGQDGVLVGGVAGSDGPVTDGMLRLTSDETRVRASVPGSADGARFCGCALYDGNRDEVVVIGGRNGTYQEVPTAFLFDVETGAKTPLADGGAAAHPVGCTAFFLPGLDRGYVFGGAGSAVGFSGTTWRYDPDARTFTELDLTGPAARYDASVTLLDDETAVMAGGMSAGAGGPRFFADVWRFDGGSESWSLVPATGAAPEGRRVPWMALGPDDDTLLFGYGADSAQGSSALGDLWRFSLAEGTWTAVDVEVEGADEAPWARGFAPRLPGTLGSAGMIAGGYDGVELMLDAFELLPPDELVGGWR